MPLLLDISERVYFTLGVVARGGAVHGETIYYSEENPHFTEMIDLYDAATNAMKKFPIRKVRVIAVGKTLPYGVLLLSKPFRTTCVVSTDGNDEYFECDVTPQIESAITWNERYYAQCANERQFREDFDRFIRRAEEFYDERPSRPFADGT